MKLPDIAEFIGKKEKIPEFFISFVIGKNWVQGGLWHIVDEKAEVIATGTTDAWHDSESFVQAADDSLSAAFGKLTAPPEEVHSVVFGLPSSWVENGVVTSEHLARLRTLCERLELKPAGFVVVTEAIIHFLKGRESASISCILVGMEEEEIGVILVRGGKLVGTQLVSRSISLADDITEGLSRFGIAQPLPARIIIYNRNAHELSEASQELLSWEWPSSFFLHTPRVESASDEVIITAVAYAAASELGGGTGGEAKEETQGEVAESPVSEIRSEAEVEHVPQEQENRPAEALLTERETEEVPTHPPEKPVSSEESQGGAAAFGFQEVALPQEPLPSSELPPRENTVAQWQVRIASFFHTLFAPFRLLSLPSSGRVIAVVGVFLLVGIGALFWFVPHAAVTVYVSPKNIQETLTLSVDPTHPQNPPPGIVAGRVVTSDVSGEKTTQTSGSKTVGDRAKGEVTVFNNTSQTRTFAEGTVVTGPNGLKFTLDSAVGVASESGAPEYKPGEAKVAVTASDIGAEYNLEQGSIFSVANFATSSFSARNGSAFTGGSSREVPAVSKGDQERLEKELTAELREKAASQITQALGADETVIAESVTLRVTKREFSATEGSEAQTLRLTLTGVGEALVIAKGDLTAALLAVLKDKVPAGFSLNEDQLSARITPPSNEEDGQERDKGIVRFETTVTANLLPVIDASSLARTLRGKSLGGAREQLTLIPGFSRSSVKFSPSFPLLTARLPQRASNITITVSPEQ
ncbi:MAG: hypothetical protein AAB694_00190 [Patescibacteria group bacterium]